MTFDDETRRRLATEWESSGLDQAAYAVQNGIQPRTLRAWRQKFCDEQQPVDQSPAAIEPIAAALAAFDVRLGALESAVAEVRAGVAKCQAAVDADQACQPAPNGVGAVPEAYEDKHQVAGGMPVPQQAVVPANGIDTEKNVAAEPISHEPAAEQTPPAAPRKRKGKRSIFFDDLDELQCLAPEPDAEAPTALAVAVQQPVAAVEQSGAPGGPNAAATSVAPFPNAAWGRLFFCPM